MHMHSFIAAGLVASAAVLIGAMPATARAGWSAAAEAGRHDASLSAVVYPNSQYPQQYPQQQSPASIAPPGPFLQINPNSYLYPQPVYPQRPPQYQQPYIDPNHAWQERQWRESQWHERERIEQEQRAWHDWGQHDRSDRVSREREGRDRDWHDRQDRGDQANRNMQQQFGPDSGQNGPTWGYRENRR